LEKGLVGEEWNNFVKGLISSSIDLNNEKDTLMWFWNTKRGQVNEKHAYEVQIWMEGG